MACYFHQECCHGVCLGSNERETHGQIDKPVIMFVYIKDCKVLLLGITIARNVILFRSAGSFLLSFPNVFII